MTRETLRDHYQVRSALEGEACLLCCTKGADLDKIALSVRSAQEALDRQDAERYGDFNQSLRACKEFGAIHCVFPAGNAVVAAVEVEEIVRAEWRDLGMPETLWNCRVKEFDPLIVSIDSEGRNYFEEKKVEYNQRKDEQVAEIRKQVGFIK